ncbi:TonB-dependent receptor [Salmonella enterica]|uniref:TonB-dependent receptor n=1 Tax=Salmonella enterica TaxID=28901 RepID=UPI0031BE76C8
MLKKLLIGVAPIFYVCYVPTTAGKENTEHINDNNNVIIVSAEKRPTVEKNTPVSIAHFSGEELVHQKAETIEDIVRRVPNMSMLKSGKASPSTKLSIRGITSLVTGEESVGFFIDDVYYAQPDLDLFDIDSIDILRGPQSTLYGRNTEAGAVSIHTVAPDNIDEYEVRAGYANYNTRYLQGTAGGGINKNENWSWRTALKIGSSDGYFNRPADSNRKVNKDGIFSGRFQLRWYDPSSPWDITATYYGRHQNGNNISIAPLDAMRSHPGNVYSNYTGYIDNSIDSLILKASYDLDNAQITSISAATKEVNNEWNDVDFSPVDMMRSGVDINYRRFSQELRINSTNDENSSRWLAGIYFFDQRRNMDIVINMPMMNRISPSGTSVDTTNLAGFGQFSLPLIKDVTITAGLRYDYETQHLDFHNTTASKQDNQTYHALLPKVSVNWQLNDNASLYTSTGSSYRSGGFNTRDLLANSLTYNPEYTWNYEVGAKTNWLDGRLASNLTLFQIDLKDQQVRLTRYPVSEIKNAGKSRSRGVEWDINWRPISPLTLSAGLGYSDMRFVEYKDNIYSRNGTLIGVNDYHDKRVPNTPDLTWSVGIDYRFNNGMFTRADVLGVGRTYHDLNNNHKQDSYQILNLRLGYDDPAWRIMLWADNVTNEVFYSYATNANGTWVGQMGSPRTYGISVGYKW